MTNINHLTLSAHEMSEKVTLKNGYWFLFKDGENRIAVHGSALSGREKVYFNDELMSDRYCFGFNSRHEFEADGKKYEVLFLMTALTTATVECMVISGDRVIGRETKAYYRGSRSSIWQRLAIFFGAGIISGITVASLLDGSLQAWLATLFGNG